MAAVSTMIFVFLPSPAADSSRMASMPGSRGMLRSNSNTSGSTCLVCVTASLPSAASPTTSSSGSASSSRRRPSRKIVWSSAITMRTVATLLSIESIPFLRHRDLQARAMPRTRFDYHITADSAHSLFNYCWTPMQVIQFREGEASREAKPATIVVDHQLPESILRTEPDIHRSGATVLSDVNQTFLHDPDQFAARHRRKRNLL